MKSKSYEFCNWYSFLMMKRCSWPNLIKFRPLMKILRFFHVKNNNNKGLKMKIFKFGFYHSLSLTLKVIFSKFHGNPTINEVFIWFNRKYPKNNNNKIFSNFFLNQSTYFRVGYLLAKFEKNLLTNEDFNFWRVNDQRSRKNA